MTGEACQTRELYYTETVSESLCFQENATGLFVKAEGHITAVLSADLREVIFERLSREPVPPLLGVDLSACDYMDSTFMGLLVGFHKKFKVLSGRSLTVLRPSPECTKLLTGLGILKLMERVEGPVPPSPTEWVLVTKNLKPTVEVILSAHRNLSELSPDNEKKFASLQEALEQQVKKGL